REHPAQLGRDEPAGDEERREREDPEDENRRPRKLKRGAVDDEQDDRDEHDHEVERTERPRYQSRRDPLGDHRLVIGLACHRSPPTESPNQCGEPAARRRESCTAGGSMSSALGTPEPARAYRWAWAGRSATTRHHASRTARA